MLSRRRLRCPARRARRQQWDKARVAMATQVACRYTFDCLSPALEMKATMSRVILPEPDRAIVARRDAIVADLRRLVGADAIIADEEGRRAYETDALTAYRRLPLAVVLPASTEEVSRAAALLPPATTSRWWRAAPAPRCRAARCRPRMPWSSACRA